MKEEVFITLQKGLLGVKKNVPLKRYTTFRIGGPAEYFFIAKDIKNLVAAIKLAKKLKLPVFVFGEGSNLLVADEGLKGLVIKLDNRKIIRHKLKITADAGVPMKDVVNTAINSSLKGLEWAGGLPGTFGGAIRGNAGAFGGEMKDSVISVTALGADLKLRKFNHAQCKFSYRNSVFKEKGLIIVSAVADLQKGDKKELRAVANSRIAYRNEKHPLEYPSAGSVFKNVPVEQISEAFRQEFWDKVKQDPFPIVPAAWFIIGAGLAGRKIGQAQISKKHSNYIVNLVNLGNAKAKDVLALIEVVKREVKNKYGIALEVEIQYVK